MPKDTAFPVRGLGVVSFSIPVSYTHLGKQALPSPFFTFRKQRGIYSSSVSRLLTAAQQHTAPAAMAPQSRAACRLSSPV